MLTSHDKPALIVIEVERGRQLLESADQLARLLATGNLLSFARAIDVADEWQSGIDVDWFRQAPTDLQDDERAS